MTILFDISTEESPKHVVIYGPAKSGKTFLALGPAQYGYTIHMVSMEDGHKVGKQLPPEAQRNIDIIQVPDNKYNPCATKLLFTLVKQGVIRPCVEHGLHDCPLCKKDNKPFNLLDTTKLGPKDIILFDTFTQATQSFLAHIGRGTDFDWKPERDHWGMLKNMMDTVCSWIQTAPFNIIVVSHEDLVSTEDEKSQKLVPVAGSTTFSRNFAKYFDTVIYCEVKNGKHVFGSKTVYANNIVTGDRFNFDISKSERGLVELFEGKGAGFVNTANAKEGDKTTLVKKP